MVYTQDFRTAGVGSIPTGYGPVFFFALFVTCLAEKIGFPCTNKACQKKISAHRLAICISSCAGWVCSSDLQPNFRSVHDPCAVLWRCKAMVQWYMPLSCNWQVSVQFLGRFFSFFLSLVLLRKLGFPFANKASQNQLHLTVCWVRV